MRRQQEAGIVFGLLRTAGFECGHRDTDALEGFIASGQREILAHKSDLEDARASFGSVARNEGGAA